MESVRHLHHQLLADPILEQLLGVDLKPCNITLITLYTNVTLHHKMGPSVRFGDFELGIASYRTFSALFNGENRFKINKLLTEIQLNE